MDYELASASATGATAAFELAICEFKLWTPCPEVLHGSCPLGRFGGLREREIALNTDTL